MNAPIPAAWADLTREQRVRLLSRHPLALACTVQGGRRWRHVTGVLVDGSLTPVENHGVYVPNVLYVAVKVNSRTRAWSMETHDPDSPMLDLVFDLSHEGTAAYLRWVVEGV